MPSRAYQPAAPDSVGMADALDHDEVFDHTPAPQAASSAVPAPVNAGPMIRDQVALKPFSPSFGAPKQIKPKAPFMSYPTTTSVGGMGLPTDPKQVQEQKAKLHNMGVTYQPNVAAPKHPEPKQTTIGDAPPAMSTMLNNIPAFAQEVYGDAAPNRQLPEPLMNHPRNQQQQSAAPPPIQKVAAPPPPMGRVAAAPPPAPVAARAPVVAPAPAPPVVHRQAAPAQPASKPAPAPQQQQTEDTSAAIPKNAKKVVTTTTTTTKIVDGKEVTETHVHHSVVVKKKGFGMPKFLKNLGGAKEKKTTTTTTTTTEE
ncbi:expressed unknown protein [Seminavis robusta]|uniref:Uncharacterized protein n=1 Tax=Seminavis robusta TaxID=568900 RepID=A0A9N8DJY5_9STRA|nr:expressed unknown protein [Seminavis robusta]|eukprot:Sro163_g073190.1 n/a (312) ;mRNA; r:47123-48058